MVLTVFLVLFNERISILGMWLLIDNALVVAVFAALEWRALSRMSAAAAWKADHLQQ
jgi:hypothetical protein